MSEATTIANWRKLVRSGDPETLRMALELARTISDSIQDELLFWFFAQESVPMRQEIWALLDEDRRALADALTAPRTLRPVDRLPNFDYFTRTEDPLIRQVLLRLGLEDQDVRQFKVRFIKEYQRLTGKSAREGRNVIRQLLDRSGE